MLFSVKSWTSCVFNVLMQEKYTLQCSFKGDLFCRRPLLSLIEPLASPPNLLIWVPPRMQNLSVRLVVKVSLPSNKSSKVSEYVLVDV